MSDIRLRELDRADEADVRAFWELNRDAVADRPYNTYLAWQAARTYVTSERDDGIVTYLVAEDDGLMVGTIFLFAPVLDNTHLAYADIFVAADRRREGIGSRLLDEAVELARGARRRLLSGEAYAPVDADSAALSFVRSKGFDVVLEDGMKAVDLVATRASWRAMAAEIAPLHRDYRLVTHWDRVPDELMGGYCDINNAFVSLAPSGNADVEDEQWDEARVRNRESRTGPAGRHDVMTFALDSSGQVVGLSELFINETAPHRAFQGGTLVVPGHRGHRLGLAVKLANHQALVERFPGVEWMVTGNADVNVNMNAINETLGYRVVERCLEVQRAI